MARYRDSETGKFVARSTWTRSKAQGGTRYKREYAKPAKQLPEPKERELEEPEEIVEDEEAEYEGAFDSP